MSDDAPNRAWAIEEAARAALLAIEQGKSFDHLDDVIAPALRQALRDPRIANTELRRLDASCEDYAQHKQRQDQRVLELAERVLELKAQRDALLEALKEITPSMPPVDAPCHYGIVPQEKCGHCGRIAKALAAIKAAEGEKA